MLSILLFLGEGWILLCGGDGIGTPRHHHLIVAANSVQFVVYEGTVKPKAFLPVLLENLSFCDRYPKLWPVMFGSVPWDFHEFPNVASQEYMKQYALDNARKADILNSERQNSLRLVRGIAESLPVGDQVADAEAWLWKSIIWGVSMSYESYLIALWQAQS